MCFAGVLKLSQLSSCSDMDLESVSWQLESLRCLAIARVLGLMEELPDYNLRHDLSFFIMLPFSACISYLQTSLFFFLNLFLILFTVRPRTSFCVVPFLLPG